MNNIDSPSSLAQALVELFPSFAAQIEGEDITGYHQVIGLLTPVITGYLHEAPKGTTERFCEVVNAMVDAGGEVENAISTCLLEHVSQVKVRRIISPYLSASARQELR